MDPVIVRYETTYSTYEVDHTGPGFRVRRLTSTHEPTPKQGRDGEWRDAVSIDVRPDERLVFHWSDDPLDATITSPVARATPLVVCAHCGEPQRGAASAFGKDLCHPDDGLDCYRLVTVYGEPVGARRNGSIPPPLSDSAPYDELPAIVR